MTLVRYTTIVLLALSFVHQASAKTTTDAVFIRSLFIDFAQKDETQKRQIIRQLTLYRMDKKAKTWVAIPELAKVFLSSKEPETIRREAAKAIFTLGGEKSLARAFVPLLQKNRISLMDSLEAVWLADDVSFLPAIVQLATAVSIDDAVREKTLLTMLALWPAERCDESIMALTERDDPNADIPENPAFKALRQQEAKKEPKKETVSPAPEALERLVFAPKKTLPQESELKALLALGCLGNKKALTGILKRFPHQGGPNRLRIATFLGFFQEKRAIPTLGTCSRDDRSKQVRLRCLASLNLIGGGDVAFGEMRRTFATADFETKTLIVDLLSQEPKGRSYLNKLLKNEKDPTIQLYIKEQLQN